MRVSLYIFFLLIVAACHDVKVGYLETGPNWVSPPIQGVEGTQPIYYSIESIKTENGDLDKCLKEIKVRGDGTFDIPFRHSIPAGTYVISLRVKNEGYSKVVKEVFTFIVKE